MKNKSLPPPQIFDFLDVGHFLKEHYAYKKQTSSGFSYEVWAKQLGIKSRSLLRMVVTGQRALTKPLATSLSQGLKLNSAESQYFFLLIEHKRARNQEQKKFFWKQMSLLIKNREPRSEITDPQFLSSHWLLKIQTLLTYKDLHKTSSRIASLLGIKAETVENLLEQLTSISGVRKTVTASQETLWSSPLKAFKVPEAVQNAALKEFYLQAFEDAKNAIPSDPKTRKYRSLLLPLNEAEYAELLEKLEEAFQDFLASYDSDELKGRRLYQLTTSLIPITKPWAATMTLK